MLAASSSMSCNIGYSAWMVLSRYNEAFPTPRMTVVGGVPLTLLPGPAHYIGIALYRYRTRDHASGNARDHRP
jgi:hypothetical protein